jgi:MFS superfamily sulfate permease-like transporter
MGSMDSRERLHRFDDIFKLSITLVSIILAFGSRFTELNTVFFASLIAIYVGTLVLWSLGHLSNGMSKEVFNKLGLSCECEVFAKRMAAHPHPAPPARNGHKV